MKVRSWSPEQKRAIQVRGCNLLVAAAAGAGKTSVLVERIISRLKDPTDPVDVDRLLVVTFTNAAAAQMRERIGRELARALNHHPSTALQRQLNLLNHAAIITLHSFCLDIVRRHFYRLGLDPGFRVADEGETSLLQLEVLEELLEYRYQQEDNQQFLALVDSYGGERDDTRLFDIVLKLYRFARSNPWPEYWLQQALAGVAPGRNIDEYGWCHGLKRNLVLQLEGSWQHLDLAIDLCRGEGGPAVYIDNLEEDRAMVERMVHACRVGWEELHRSFQEASFGKLKSCRQNMEVDAAVQKQVQQLRETVKKRIYGLRDSFFNQTPEQHLLDLQRMAPVLQTLVELVLEFGERFRRAKTSRGMVDFQDLEHYCLQVLRQEESPPETLFPSPVAWELQEQFVEVLVDEYQDINAVQEAILQLVSRQNQAPNLFMVGDVKQSIYRFRLAEPGLFQQKYEQYKSGEHPDGCLIELQDNYRSCEPIIEGVNYIFRQIMTPGVGEIDYRQAELKYGLKRPEDGENRLSPGIEVFVIDRNSETEKEESGQGAGEIETPVGEEEELLDTAQVEARIIAKQLKDMVENGESIWDQREEGYRPVRYGDMAVLMRATRGTANIFVEELRRAEIPVYAELGTGYFAAGEVATILSLLQLIDNPRQDIPLVAVLRSPLVGLSAEELARIRCCEKGQFYQAAIAASSALQGETQDKLAAFFDCLEQWRTMARRQPLTTLLWDIYRDTGYYDYVGGMPGGSQRQANLRLLYTWAERYETTTFRGLFHFLRFIERLRESGGDMGSARALGENEDVVRVMSIHKSKGLEFPVVCVAGLGRRINFSDIRGMVLAHKEGGIGLQYVDTGMFISYPTLPKLALQHRIRLETLAEEMRLLYVAMTRARERLLLVGTARNLKQQLIRWHQVALGSIIENRSGSYSGTLREADLASAGSFLDWIGPALINHPDAMVLREGTEWPEMPMTATARFSIYVIGTGVAGLSQPSLPGEETVFDRIKRRLPLEPQGYQEEIDGRLAWEYPYQAAVRKSAKLPVTEIKRLFGTGWENEEMEQMVQPTYLTQPRFVREEQGLTAAERGSATHTVLQHLELGGQLDSRAIKQLLDRMVGKELLTPEQAHAVDVGAIARFFSSKLGQRVLHARKILRELPFTMALPAGKVYPELDNKGEKVMVQGVIDCLADEGDGYLLVDYKTNWLTPGRLEELMEQYRWQLQLYAQAVEAILKRPVKEKYLYFLAGDIACKID